MGAPGVCRFRLPADGWVDLDAARSAVHLAETGLSHGDLEASGANAFVARLISARELLAGRDGSWLAAARRELCGIRLRSLECSAQIHLRRGAAGRAVRDARLAVELEPLREPGWRLLMDAHAAAGDVASALDAYARCAVTLRESLGVGPSSATRQRHAALLALAG